MADSKTEPTAESPQSLTLEYAHARVLKYGCNPHQKPASIYHAKGGQLPFKVLNGNPGYINLLDALNSWQLVSELKTALQLPAAASFKHVSPAGAAVAVPLSDMLKQVYDVGKHELTPLATAYLRARNADPKSSFGDFAALSDRVDEATALIIKREVSDGVIAPGFDDKALEILKGKQGGRFIVLEADVNYKPPEMEYREVFGVCFAQKRNNSAVTKAMMKDVVTACKDMTDEAVRDLVVASIAVKYTQSNSVTYAKDGQVIGVGAGQQSRVDCVELAGSKVDTWYMRQHPKVLALKFKQGLKRVERTNASVAYAHGDMTETERKEFESKLTEVPAPLTTAERAEFMKTLSGVALSSDAFFPFRDNIDQAAKRGVKYIAQPGGSVQDDGVTAACDEYGMAMCHTKLRLFHH